MKCKFCGTEVDEKQRFCPNCGLLLDVSFTPFSVSDLQKKEKVTEEPEFLRQAIEYQEELEQEERVEAAIHSEEGLSTSEDETEREENAVLEEDIVEMQAVELSSPMRQVNEEEQSEVSDTEEEQTLENSLDSDAEKNSQIEDEESDTEENEAETAEEKEEAVEETEETEKTVEETEKTVEETEKTVEETGETEDVEEVVEETETAEETEDIKDTVEETENAENTEDTEEIEETEKTEKTEKTEEIELTEATEEDADEAEEKSVEADDEAFEEKMKEEIPEEGEESNTEEEDSDALIYKIQDKQEEKEFFGEIPDDPDDFRENSAIPPTSMKELKASMPSKKIVAATVAVAVLGFTGINYLNSTKVRYDSFLKKGENLLQAKQYSEAAESLEKDKESFQVDERYYLLLSDAWSKEGKHEEAVACLMEGAKRFPENEEIQKTLKAMDPKVSSNITEDLYHDSLEINLESSSNKILYSLSGGKDEILQEEYTGPISISRNGKYSLMAYAVASDGAKGELYIKEFTVDLDKEKYHLSSFVDSEKGKEYIDENGDKAIGWTLIDGSYYYFDEQGIMQTGFLELDGEKYYLDENGKMHTGRLDLDGKSYYFDEQGHMIRDAWIENRYYVDENGEMLKNQQNGEGVYFDENGNRSFNAESLYKEHPDSILAIVSKDRKTDGNHYLFSAKVYYHKKNGRPSGEVAYETEIVLSKSALMRYLDENLPIITAKDAVSFLPNLYLQEIVQNKDGVITSFSFVLGERHS